VDDLAVAKHEAPTAEKVTADSAEPANEAQAHPRNHAIAALLDPDGKLLRVVPGR
jgi:hypothetical protein